MSHTSTDTDNRDTPEMFSYLEARIEAFKRRIVELETENGKLKKEIRDLKGDASICVEYSERLPTSSEHVWQADHKGIPAGNCLKCGEPIERYNERMMPIWKRLQEHARVESGLQQQHDGHLGAVEAGG